MTKKYFTLLLYAMISVNGCAPSEVNKNDLRYIYIYFIFLLSSEVDIKNDLLNGQVHGQRWIFGYSSCNFRHFSTNHLLKAGKKIVMSMPYLN